ncbi:MAG: methylmalonyl Co-A mutase-associated GTPase MeaB [Smithellaceae bacterium]
MLKDLLERFQRKERQALAKVISLIEKESSLKEDILKNKYFCAGHAKIIGFTGSPGAGKSSLIDQIVDLIRSNGETVGIVAVDPTSPFSGGALLGDRIRMQKHGLDKGVFIRSMGTRGNLGGLARSTKEVVRIMDAFGKDWIIVETVGVGQAEVDIMNIAHTTVLVMTPNTGDAIQTIKAGIMEIADVFAVNKCDLAGADRLVIEIETMLNMKMTEEKWRPPVIKTSTLKEEGVNDLLAAVKAHGEFLLVNGIYDSLEKEKASTDMMEILTRRWQEHVSKHMNNGGPVSDWLKQVLNRQMDPYTAATKIMEFLIRPESRNSQNLKR